MKSPRPAARLALALAALAVVAIPHHSASQACDDTAARNLLLTSWVNSALNPPKQEDVEFFTRQGGVPNIMVIVDTSGSMVRLPPDGPLSLGGGESEVPPGFPLYGNNRTSLAAQSNAWTATAATRPVGCGLDPVSAALPGFTDNEMLRDVINRRFYPPCGNAVDPTIVGAPYQGHSVDYPQQMSVCPRFTSSDSQAVGAPGFDPDYYAASNATTVSGKPNFFPRNLVFHDSDLRGTYSDWSGGLAFRTNFGDGWDDQAVYPSKASSNSYDTIQTFCARQGNALQGAMTRAAICEQCLTEAGWYYDGILLDTTSNGVYFRFPSLWYTGNYLSFYPPKFVMAKKVLKDTIAVQSRVRMAMSRFDGNNGATVFQQFNPQCGQPDNSNFDSNRASYVSSVDALTFIGGTPLSGALFDVARYYKTPDLPWFGAGFESAAKESSANANQSAICYSCQTSSVVLITDGQPHDDEGQWLPSGGLTAAQLTGAFYAGNTGTGIRGISNAVCPKCNPFGAGDFRNNLIKTAFYVHNMDLRRNEETTLDCKGNGGKQSLDVYTVGFATSTLPDAATILSSAAEVGGGSFVRAEDASALKQGLVSIIEQINTRSTSFSVATVSTLQTTAGRSVIVPRFDPSKESFWRGHLSRFDLYSEFVNTCEATPTGNGAGDLDCDGFCTSVFLQDAEGDFISEDTNGVFRKNDPPNLPTCDSAPRCVARGMPCAVPGTAEATEWWNAGDDLASRAWRDRKVYSIVDDSGDGRIDQADTVFELTTTGDAAAGRLVPYLGLGTLASGIGVCETIADKLNGAGAPAWGTLVSTSKIECAKAIIRYLKGADLFNDTESPTYPAADMESAVDRDFKLGDIFHSSPVVVDPPLPPSGYMCEAGASNQCLSALWKTPTRHEDDENAYEKYAESAAHRNRRKVVLVGANDGLLHAFNGGTWRAGVDDPTTTALDESQAPFNGYYERGNLSGGGHELWAFLPPGLIGKVSLLLTGNEHHLFADGSPMVRDVWVDGSDNGLGSTSAPDDVKSEEEFHTVAVVPLRRGGTHFFALDVTNATEPGAPPEFLWMFPQPNDRRSLVMGETYDSFLPRPPPIGPVRLAATAVHPDTPTFSTATDPSNQRYHERWVAFLNGGFDPQYVRGRGVYMVDVWTGDLIWDFAYPDDPSSVAADDPRLQLRFPVAATVGMVPWGQTVQRREFETNEYFFDTATFGDTGGQLWTLRFSDPGRVGTSGLVENWFGGRAFQMGGAGTCRFCGAQPFFYMTANVQLPESGFYRIFAGTGDRFNLLDKNGGVCGPDNLRACAMRGCTVTLTTAENFLASPDLGSRSWSLSSAACNAMTNGGAAGAHAACGAEGAVRVVISACPSPSPNTAPNTTYKDIAVRCSNQADGEYACLKLQNDQGTKLSLSDTSNAPGVGNWFFSLVAFEQPPSARTLFSTAAGAKAYDAARLHVTQSGATRTATPGITLMAASNNAPATVATSTSLGWAVHYDHGPTVTADAHLYNVSWMDERTSGTTAVRGRVITWSSIQSTLGEVTSASASCRTSRCTAVDRRVSYHYGADVVTGAPIFEDTSGNPVRAQTGTNLVPPQGDQTTVFVNQQGQVAIGLTSVSPERGASNVAMSATKEPTYGVGVVEVTEKNHACRHAWPGSEANPTAAPPTQEICRQ